MVGGFIAATVVTLVQYLRLHDRRLLPLLALFACQAQALSREWYDFWKDVFQAGACAAGLVLLLMLSPRHARAATGSGDPPSVPRPPSDQPAPETPPETIPPTGASPHTGQ